MSPQRATLRIGSLACLLILQLALPASALDGDAHWASRGQGMREARADPAPVQRAIRAYEAALDADPADLTVRWKLVRALHFLGEFARVTPDARRQSLDRAVDVAEKGLRSVRETVAAEPHELEPPRLRAALGAAGLEAVDVARLHYWASASWGSWSQDAGLVAVVRTGVANRLREYLDVVVALEPGYEGAGAHRFLGTLHARLPRLPFLSGWVDRDRAVPQLERALSIAPDEPSNRLLLGLVLLDLEPAKRSQGLGLLAGVATLEPRPERRVEDAVVVREARERLELEGDTTRPTG